MDKINLLISVTTVSLFISLFLAFFLVTVKTKNKISNVLFAVFLLIIAVDIRPKELKNETRPVESDL